MKTAREFVLKLQRLMKLKRLAWTVSKISIMEINEVSNYAIKWRKRDSKVM